MSKLKPRDLHKIQRRRSRLRQAVSKTWWSELANYFRNGGRILEIAYEPSELTKRMLRGREKP